MRNSAIQTIQRIFENYADQLSSNIWMLCLRIVLFGTVKANLSVQHASRAASRGSDDINNWNETTKAVLQTVGVLTTTYMENLDASQFNDAWSELLDYLQQYFTYNSHTLGASVFSTITGVLSHVHDAQALGTAPLLKTATVWKSYFDSRDAWQHTQERNQEAFVAYADAFIAIYHLAGESLSEDLPLMLAKLEACIIDSDTDAYSSDVDSMTSLQVRVIECISMVKIDTSDTLPSYVLSLLSRLILLPYISLEKNTSKRGPTFVAFSKASMTLLQSIAIKHVDQEDIYTSNAYTSALRSLARPIQEKYSWQREGKPPTLWQKATTTALAILKPALPQISAHSKASTKEIWTILVEIVHYVTRAHISLTQSPQTSLGKDEAFDIESFTRLRHLITLSLGSTSLPDSLRRIYSRNLFSTSLIHTPLPGELPDVTAAPLEDLYTIRFGQTAELESTLRTEMSYVCLAELFNLVAMHDSSPERIKLAQAAAPYLILRAALPLRTYIADHPLRGRMPAPESQRREFLFVLNELGKLKGEPQAIPDAPGVKSKYKKHLHRLYPLLIKASKVAKHDTEVFEQLVKLIDIVGDEFGLEDE